MIRSPSQWPGTARSSASAGRSLISTSGVTCARPSAGSSPRHSQRPPGAQTGDQLALERATALHVERLVDRLVADPHGLIIGEVDLQPVRDLLRAPRLSTHRRSPRCGLFRPSTRRLRARRPRRRGWTTPGEPVLHVLAQPLVARPASRSSGAAPAARRATARRRPVVQPARRVGGVAAQLTRDRRRSPAQPRAISRTPSCWACSSAISSRSANDK